jgi:sugar phosphate isomerase/epimerase
MAYPRFSISESTTNPATFEADLAAYKKAGADGIGIWEFKLPKGQDSRLRDELQKSGLQATVCVPQVPCIVPDAYFAEPQDPALRLKELCAAIRRFAAYKPLAVMIVPGAPGDDPAKSRRTVIEGLKVAADTAAEVGVTIGLEGIRKDAGSLFNTLPELVEVIEEVGANNIRIIFDTWHFWDTPGVYDDIRKHAKRIIGLQVNDRRAKPRSWADRVLPGDGVMDLATIFGTLEAAGYTGWYDMEIFSDRSYPDSLWNLPVDELARRCVTSFRTVWDKRKTLTSRK